VGEFLKKLSGVQGEADPKQIVCYLSSLDWLSVNFKNQEIKYISTYQQVLGTFFDGLVEGSIFDVPITLIAKTPLQPIHNTRNQNFLQKFQLIKNNGEGFGLEEELIDEFY
jgi:hypothetical protein